MCQSSSMVMACEVQQREREAELHSKANRRALIPLALMRVRWKSEATLHSRSCKWLARWQVTKDDVRRARRHPVR